MREILFKAKRVENGEWIEGYYYKVQETVYCFEEDYEKNPVPIHHFIIFTRTTDWGLPMQVYQTEIIPETLCQFTGLTDKNGNKIWENDIVTCQTKYGGDIGKVVFHNGKFCVLWNSTYHYPQNGKCENYYDINTKNSVKGNVFDNPELLQEESDE